MNLKGYDDKGDDSVLSTKVIDKGTLSESKKRTIETNNQVSSYGILKVVHLMIQIFIKHE
jgi:hypothetical protein